MAYKIHQSYCLRFGDVAVKLGYLNSDRVKQALQKQADAAIAGDTHQNMGAISYTNGWLTIRQIEDVLNKIFQAKWEIDKTMTTPSKIMNNENKSILFIDDDPNVLTALERMLRPLVKDWNFIFTDSAIKGLAILEEKSIHVVASDICMPLMDGFELQSVIKKKYPNIVRVLMTGQSDFGYAHNPQALSHYFLWKPIQAEGMKILLQLLSNEEICMEA